MICSRHTIAASCVCNLHHYGLSRVVPRHSVCRARMPLQTNPLPLICAVPLSGGYLMPQKRSKSAYAWLWVLALAALSAAISITHYKIGDSDYYWHCMYGQILATTHKMPTTDPVSWLAAESGLHYIDYSWFCDLLLYKLSLLGPIETYGGLLFFLLFSIPVTILIFGLWGQGVIQRLQQGWQLIYTSSVYDVFIPHT